MNIDSTFHWRHNTLTTQRIITIWNKFQIILRYNNIVNLCSRIIIIYDYDT